MMHGYLGFPFMGISMIASIIVIVIIFLVFNNKDKENKTPQDILDKRYVKGEIDFDEYHEKSKKIKKG